MTAGYTVPSVQGMVEAGSVTEGHSAPCNAEFSQGRQDGGYAGGAPVDSAIEAESAITFGERVAALLDALVRWSEVEFRPPAVWADPPASLAALSRYARVGGWTGRADGFVRTAGIWWHRLIGLPITVAAYYGAWVAQRPGRVFTVSVLYVLIAHTGPGSWLLPWPEWLP